MGKEASMITKDLVESIRSRAAVLSRRYYFLEPEDMMQNGYILLMELEKKKLSNLQKHKAINNMFSNLERNALVRLKVEKNQSSFGYEPDAVYEGENQEEQLEREQMTEMLVKSLTKQEVILLDWLSNGWSLDDMARALGITRDRVRRIVMGIINKRKELEENAV